MFLENLTENCESQLWELVKLADHEFVPSLSSRYSTIQGDLQPESEAGCEGPGKYFEGLKNQQFIVYTEGEKIVGFMSYIPRHSLEIPGIDRVFTVTYISTVIVHPDHRGKGITEKMYLELLQKATLPLATRTWSTNSAHIHILNKLQFDIVATLKNDRGENIDTVYFVKNM